MENINPWALDEKEKINRKILLDELANDIAKKFWIKKEKAISFIKSDSLKWLDNLKKEISESKDSSLNKLKNKEIEKLFLTLKWAHEIIENSAKIEIKILKNNVEKTINIDDFKNHIEDYLPKKLIEKAKNPKNLHQQILGFALWSANSIFATADILYQIWAGILKTPYHLYMIVTWKWEIKSMKDI